ncbi:Na+/H+ antiporter subunit E [Aurantimonas aggregata]|uniref:Na+/H+ antiporter subunit E n=1 Tax=Aurantimonas aggregata TaxID=2047720 RepID=A0A6L9MDN5_9HYPH|nr:Na+/H+ antiporter subunit E [Aurantimonas aggregata]NDV85791.1 Na+/H+ antiporter subunit E [Aurantimonas aggregata]
MTMLLFNLVLALMWVVVSGSFTLLNLLFGFLLGGAALYLIREEGNMSYAGRARLGFSLFLLFLLELLKSAWRVAVMVLSPNMNLKPGILAFPLRVKSDAEITLLANMITLTPGTLSIDVSEDRSTLYIHAFDCSDPDAAKADIRDGFEARILQVFR